MKERAWPSGKSLVLMVALALAAVCMALGVIRVIRGAAADGPSAEAPNVQAAPVATAAPEPAAEPRLAELVPAGLRAYTVGVCEVRDDGTPLRSGETVEVFALFPREATGLAQDETAVLRDVPLIALAPLPEGLFGPAKAATPEVPPVERAAYSTRPKAFAATLAVTVEQAQSLALAERSGEVVLRRCLSAACRDSDPPRLPRSPAGG